MTRDEQLRSNKTAVDLVESISSALAGVMGDLQERESPPYERLIRTAVVLGMVREELYALEEHLAVQKEVIETPLEKSGRNVRAYQVANMPTGPILTEIRREIVS